MECMSKILPTRGGRPETDDTKRRDAKPMPPERVVGEAHGMREYRQEVLCRFWTGGGIGHCQSDDTL